MADEPPIADERLRQFFDRTLDIASDLALASLLQRIVATACEVSGARYGALGVVGDDGRISEFVLEGADPEWIERVGHPPEGKGLIGYLIDHPEPLRLTEMSEHPSSIGFPAGHPPMHTFLGAPIRIGAELFGNLYLTEKSDGGPFTADDETLVLALAAAASVAIQNSRLYEETQDLAIIRERERIARDLHDRVIQRLFATAMSLEAAARASLDPDARESLTRSVDDLDDTIREIRSTIFELGQDSTITTTERVQKVTAELEGLLGFTPVVLIQGPLDHIPDRIADELVPALREMLTNIAKHAQASIAHVTIHTNAKLAVRVSDNGLGIAVEPPPTGSHGLRNLAERAEMLGGSCHIGPGSDGGTVVDWTVPITA